MKLSRRGKRTNHARRGRHTKRVRKHHTRRIKHRGKQYKRTYRKNNRKSKHNKRIQGGATFEETVIARINKIAEIPSEHTELLKASEENKKEATIKSVDELRSKLTLLKQEDSEWQLQTPTGNAILELLCKKEGPFYFSPEPQLFICGISYYTDNGRTEKKVAVVLTREDNPGINFGINDSPAKVKRLLSDQTFLKRVVNQKNRLFDSDQVVDKNTPIYNFNYPKNLELLTALGEVIKEKGPNEFKPLFDV